MTPSLSGPFPHDAAAKQRRGGAVPSGGDPLVYSRYHFDDFGNLRYASRLELFLDNWARPVFVAVIIALSVAMGVIVLHQAVLDEKAADQVVPATDPGASP